MESVLVVPSERLRPFLTEKGLVTDRLDETLAVIMSGYEFLPRPEAEQNPGFKQIIPYVVLRNKGRVFVMRRLPRGGEARLHGMLSLGVGGHINPGEDGGDNVLLAGLYRELGEEVFVEKRGEPGFVGVINDDTTPVGSVHLGLLCVMDVSGEVRVLETEKLEGFWRGIDELPGLADKMESWSAMAIGAL